MVGLSVVLEAQKGGDGINKKTPQVINKTTMMLSTSTINKPSQSLPPPPALSSQHLLFQASTFLDQCFLCRKRLLPGKDIYMYKGDRAFCSVDCRCKQIFTDEEEAAIQKWNCSLAAMTMRTTSSASSSSSSSSTARHHRKGARNRAGGGFAY